MLVTESWLSDWVKPPVDTQTLVSQLTMAGLEVDSVQPVAGEFSGVVVGEVLTVEQHPNADKLKVCQVNTGSAGVLQIVCGAANVHPGMKAPAALVGAVLPGDFKIKASKLRGESSLGMLCSEKELGLAATADGLLELPADAPAGMDVREYLQLDDHILELDLTPNRADCLSMEGVAREMAVLNGLPFEPAAFPATPNGHDLTLEVLVEDSQACPAYHGRLIHNINHGAATPFWMQERLRRCGLRSLGPAVDATNYVLQELGQPLHAFDAAKLSPPVVVRRSRPGETLELLNDQTVTLDGGTLVIADRKQVLALAGIMGGKYSAVSAETRDIFLECAFFSPLGIAGKARQYGLHTDSSHRFERGVDFTVQQRAIGRATQLLTEIAGGSVGPVRSTVADEFLPARAPVALRRERLEKMLGIRPESERITGIFLGLGMQISASADGWTVTPPPFRFDIAIEEDLLEEIARIVGYNHLPSNSLPIRAKLAAAPEAVLPADRVQDLLVDRGYQEAITYSFVDRDLQNLITPDRAGVPVQNPISSELAVMRTTLWCGLLPAALYNVNRQQTRVRLFESGLRFSRDAAEIRQEKMIAGLALGSVAPEQWAEKPRNIDFFDIKADVEAIFALTGAKAVFKPGEHPALHPGQTAVVHGADGGTLGVLGMLHPSLEKQLGFFSPVFLFELDLEAVLARTVPQFAPLSKFPSVRRDLALIVEDAVPASAIVDCINDCRETAIRDVQIFDVYRGRGVAEGFKSIALSVILQDFSQTLTDSEIDAIFCRILETLVLKLNAKLRE